MACRNCDKEFKIFYTSCKVCELLDNDIAAKPTEYCNDCKAYICEPCWNNPKRRTAAAAINWGRNIAETIKNIIS